MARNSVRAGVGLLAFGATVWAGYNAYNQYNEAQELKGNIEQSIVEDVSDAFSNAWHTTDRFVHLETFEQTQPFEVPLDRSYALAAVALLGAGLVGAAAKDRF